MIPVRLELKNFMSYGEQVAPLDFTGMHLACLSGDNGNGKSAVLDAITWVLWGEARASADQLIRLGTEEMCVTLEFLLGGDLYRVVRGRSKRNSGNIWELYVKDTSGRFKAITGQGIRDTGRTIQKILRMDYKTFINSACIQQGRADEFTKQSVADRKKILADILDLSRYDALEQKAKDRRNGADILVQELEREIGRIAEDLAEEDACKTALAEAESGRAELEQGIALKETRLRELQARHAELDAVLGRVQGLEKEAASWRTEILSLTTQQKAQEDRVAGNRKIIAERDKILEGLSKLRAARESTALLDARLQELRGLEKEKAGLESIILGERHKLDTQRQMLSRELAELESKISGAAAIEQDIARLRSEVEELDKLQFRRTELERKVNEESDRLGMMKGQHDGLMDRKKELEEKLAMISLPGAKCPLCQTELGHEKHEEVIADYRRRIAEMQESINGFRKDGTQAKARLAALRKEIEEIDAKASAGRDVRNRLAKAEQVVFTVEESNKRMPSIKAKLDEVLKSIEGGKYAPEESARLLNISSSIAALTYNPEEHNKIKEDIALLAMYESLAANLKNAENSLPGDEASLAAVRELILSRERSIQECTRSAEELRGTLIELPDIKAELALTDRELTQLRETDRELTGKIATLASTLSRIKILKTEAGEKKKALDQAKKDKAAYAALVSAFGKKGVQALIIENAIPEIQEEANRLLARMTDNAMQVAIETIRDKKTGGTAETLDIKISDDMGTRSYELFSGGEVFRVNFALRIALSKLLARRAGASLQTLIIDEGFGTQDGKGREKLVEAISSIQDDFSLILVVTHIDELKDAFPTRIEITKDSAGSQIQVN